MQTPLIYSLDLNGAMHLRDPSTDPAMTPSLIPLLRFDGTHVMPHTIGAAEAPVSCKPRIRDSIVRRRLSSTSSELCSSAFSKSGTVLACGVIPLAVSGVGVEKTGVPACRCMAACIIDRDIAVQSAFPTAFCAVRHPCGSLHWSLNPIRMADSRAVITLCVFPSRSHQVSAWLAHTVKDCSSTERTHGNPFLLRV